MNLPCPSMIEIAMISLEKESLNASDPYSSFDPILNIDTRDIDTMRNDLDNKTTRQFADIFKQMVDQPGLNDYSWSCKLQN